MARFVLTRFARSLRSFASLARGFVWWSTGISSQKEHYYNYSDIGFFGKGETLLDQKK